MECEETLWLIDIPMSSAERVSAAANSLLWVSYFLKELQNRVEQSEGLD